MNNKKLNIEIVDGVSEAYYKMENNIKQYYFNDLQINKEYGPFKTEDERDIKYDVHFQQLFEWQRFNRGIDF